MPEAVLCCRRDFQCVRKDAAFSQCRPYGIPGGFSWDGLPMPCGSAAVRPSVGVAVGAGVAGDLPDRAPASG